MAIKNIILLISFLVFFSLYGQAQKEVSIKDPELTFTYFLPEGFVNHDGDLYHYIYPENEEGYQESSIQLTYFEGFDGELSVFKDGILNGKLRNTLEDFKFVKSGSDTVDGSLALWSQYTFTDEGVNKCGELYCFTRLGQYFQIIIESPCSDFAKYEVDFKRIIRSLRFAKN